PLLTQAVEIRPDSATARNNLATSFANVGKLDEAIRECRDALRLDAGYQDARYNLASVLASKGDAQAALAELSVYLRSSPEDVQALELAGRMQVAAGHTSESLEYFRRAAVLSPLDGSVQTNLGAALAMTGDYAGAVQAFEAALKIDPTNRPARENLEQARARMQQK
ncbi:MAG: tetratricopeptide repeat protein, partial [Acidobacteriaceae bacterium]|nr:tetratricopeptide repeat protein [Acidobacteriaceae bacterium]